MLSMVPETRTLSILLISLSSEEISKVNYFELPHFKYKVLTLIGSTQDWNTVVLVRYFVILFQNILFRAIKFIDSLQSDQSSLNSYYALKHYDSLANLINTSNTNFLIGEAETHILI